MRRRKEWENKSHCIQEGPLINSAEKANNDGSDAKEK